jgi:hypothetical protein
MSYSNLIRVGGLAAMVGGVLQALVFSQPYLSVPLVRTLARILGIGPQGAFIIIIAGFVAVLALSVIAIVALDAKQGWRYGLIAVLASLAAAGGGALVLAGMLAGMNSNLSVLVLIVGALILFLGLMALGIVTIAAGMLPWWYGAMIILSPALTMLGPIGGVAWALVGYGIFRAAGQRRTERPARVR